MKIGQAVKMAWKSILGKKGRSFLTMLGIIIGIGSVMTIVSVMNGMTEMTMKQFEAMGSNRITVRIHSWVYDENGNSIPKDYFTSLYDFCASLKQYVVGVTPESSLWVTMVYGTKNTNNMQPEWDEQGNMTGQSPPSMYLGSDQYSACNNLTITKGRDLSKLDVEKYNQVCVMGAQAVKLFFGAADPIDKVVQVNGQNFRVIGVYGPRLSEEDAANSQMDNFVVFPYTTNRVLGNQSDMSEFIVKARTSDDLVEVISRLKGFLRGLVDERTGGFNVYSESQWQQESNEYIAMIGLVLGGIAAISLLVGGIGIMNIMLVTVTERTREIGIRRAIGAERSSIVVQFLIEAAMLCGIGGILGIALGTGGSILLGNIIFQMTIYPSVWITVCAFSLSVLLGIIFGIYPAAKASRLQPVEALRAE